MKHLTFRSLRERNKVRNDEFLSRLENFSDWNIVDRSNELAGEAGELSNLCKKIRRHRLGMTEEDIDGIITKIKKELADIIITADLLAMDLDIKLEDVVPAKFDESSDKFGLKTKFND